MKDPNSNFPGAKDWSKAGPHIKNIPYVFIGFFHGRWGHLSMKQGGPVRGQPSLEHALLIERATPDTRHDAAKPHLTADIRYYYKTGRCVERQDWPNIRDQVLWSLLLEKYGMTPGTDSPERATNRELLLDTAPAYIEDGNVACENWSGVCRCPRCLREKGVNIHGRLLMSLRDSLLQRSSTGE